MELSGPRLPCGGEWSNGRLVEAVRRTGKQTFNRQDENSMDNLPSNLWHTDRVLLQRGRRACESFLKYYAAQKNLPKRSAANGDVTTVSLKAEVPLVHNGCVGAAGTSVEAEAASSQSEAEVEAVLPYVDEEEEGARGSTATEVFEMTTTDETSPCESSTYCTKLHVNTARFFV